MRETDLTGFCIFAQIMRLVRFSQRLSLDELDALVLPAAALMIEHISQG